VFVNCCTWNTKLSWFNYELRFFRNFRL